jgi:signal peptidase II
VIIYAVLAAAVVLADQFAKLLVVSRIDADRAICVIPKVIDFVYVKNTGAAFSIMADMTWLLAIVSVVFCAAVAVYFVRKQPKSRLQCTALTLMFSGAMGNALDRIFRGYVVDFIRTAFIDFPVFNIADMAITVGAAVLIIYIILSEKKEKR